MFTGTDVYNNLELARLREERLRRLAASGLAGHYAAQQDERRPRWWARWRSRPTGAAARRATVRAEVAGPIKP
ncbi:hypothetical protein GCM10009681_14720 [Luedemannella helvata]|uniref:Uncharacterized protein n=1 Tax=Luedemannella helvata TaxID=349315 RepID=A0ABP4W443_9ACTN